MTATLPTEDDGFLAIALSLGFRRDLIERDYPVWVDKKVELADVVGFGSRAKDMSSALLLGSYGAAGDVSRERCLRLARNLAAPVTALSVHDGVEFLSSSNGRRLVLLGHGERPPETWRAAFSPAALLEAKTRTSQTGLFDVDVELLSTARTTSAYMLRDKLIEAIDAAKSASDISDDTTEGRDRLLGTALDALTVLFLEDKNGTNDLTDLARTLREDFPEMSGRLNHGDPKYRVAYEAARSVLRLDVNYRGLDPSTVSDLYLSGLIDAGEHNAHGVVYTPERLAVRLLERLPIEDLSPDRRRVLDPACGSGSLLLAAHGRLARARPSRGTGTEHAYLVSSLRGQDRDSVAVGIARLCLSLVSSPPSNGWDLRVTETDPEDERTPDDVDLFDILISNPPWRARRTGDRAGGSRDDVAQRFAEWSVRQVRVGGLLALVLPAGLLTSASGAPTRSYVREHCEILEVWRLPPGTFRGADAAGAALLLRRTEPGTPPGRTVAASTVVTRREHMARFYGKGLPDSWTPTRVGSGGDALGQDLAVGRHLASLTGTSPLSDIASIRSGPPKRPGREPDGGSLRWLRSVRRMGAYAVLSDDMTVGASYPEDFDAYAGWSVAEAAPGKVLVSRVQRTTPWRFKTGVDLLGVVPSNNQYALRPKQPHDDLESACYALSAILGSALVCAWADESDRTGAIPSSLLKTLAIPDGWQDMADHGRALATAQGPTRTPDVLAAVSELARVADVAVFDLFRVPTSMRSHVRQVLAGRPAPEGPVRYERTATDRTATPNRATRLDPGYVVSVGTGNVTVWVDGRTPDEGVTIPVPPTMPGALLAAGSHFVVHAGDLGAATYGFHRSAYRTPKSLVPSAPPKVK